MGMFTNYQAELLNTYQPNNIVNRFPTPIHENKLNSIDSSKPYEEFNMKGDHVGYSWYQGESVNLEFMIEGEVTVEPDSFTSTQSGSTPDNLQALRAGQKYYNLADYRSWKAYIVDGVTHWVEDTEFIYPQAGMDLKSMYVPADSYLKDKQVTVTMYDFRMKPVYTWNPVVHNSKVICAISPEISKGLNKGIYYCTLTVENQDVNFSIFNTDDCLFLIK